MRADVARQGAAHEVIQAAVPARPCSAAFAGVRRDQRRDVTQHKLVHLRLMPVARVGDDDLQLLADAGLLQLALRRRDHRLKTAEVW